MPTFCPTEPLDPLQLLAREEDYRYLHIKTTPIPVTNIECTYTLVLSATLHSLKQSYFCLSEMC